MTSWRVAACFARESNAHSGHGERRPSRPAWKTWRCAWHGCLDRLLQAPGTFFTVVMQPTFQIYQAPCGGAADQIPGQHGSLARALGVVASGGFTPQQIRTAYAIDQIEFGATKGDGTGETIAIVDADDDPNLVDSTSANFKNSDLAQFDKLFGLPDLPSFEKLGQDGTANLPGVDPTGEWEVEEALDVEWVPHGPLSASFSSSVIPRVSRTSWMPERGLPQLSRGSRLSP